MADTDTDTAATPAGATSTTATTSSPSPPPEPQEQQQSTTPTSAPPPPTAATAAAAAFDPELLEVKDLVQKALERQGLLNHVRVRMRPRSAAFDVDLVLGGDCPPSINPSTTINRPINN